MHCWFKKKKAFLYAIKNQMDSFAYIEQNQNSKIKCR